MGTRLVELGLGLAVIGCGDKVKLTPPDAPPGDCWPGNGSAAAGSATLGTGRDSYLAMPDPLPIEYGAQDGFDLVANVKMHGLLPGDPTDILNPVNPRTRILAFFAATNIPLNYYAHCPFQLGYVPSEDGSGSDFVLPQGQGVVFETCWRAQHLIGQLVRIDLDVVDSDDHYAHDSVTVTLAAPAGPYPMDPPEPGCMH